jgi:hypothetical protein
MTFRPGHPASRPSTRRAPGPVEIIEDKQHPPIAQLNKAIRGNCR